MAYDQNDPTTFGDPDSKNTGPDKGLRDAVAGIYQAALGRAPENDDAVSQWIAGSGGDIAKIQQMIYNTPEAKAYSQAQTAKSQAPTTPAPTDNMPAGIDPRLAAVYKAAGMTPSSDRGTGFADWQYWQDHMDQALNGRLAADLAGTGTDQPTGTPGSGVWSNSGAADRANGGAGNATPPPTAPPPPPGASSLGAGPSGPISAFAPPPPSSPLTPPPQASPLAPPPPTAAIQPPSQTPIMPPGYQPQGAPAPTPSPILGMPSPSKAYGPDAGNAGNFWAARSPMDFSSQKVAGDALRDQSSDLIKQLIARIKLGGNGINFNR